MGSRASAVISVGVVITVTENLVSGEGKGSFCRERIPSAGRAPEKQHLSLFSANLTPVQHKMLLVPAIEEKIVLGNQIWKKQIKVQRDIRQQMSQGSVPHVPCHREEAVIGTSSALLTFKRGPKVEKWGDREREGKQDRWLKRGGVLGGVWG